MTGALTPGLVGRLRPCVQALADDLVDARRGRGETDLVADFALRLPAMVIAELLGMSSDDADRFQRWVHTIALYFAIGSLGNAETIGALCGTVEEMAGFMRAIVEDHLRAPREDLIRAQATRARAGHSGEADRIPDRCSAPISRLSNLG